MAEQFKKFFNKKKADLKFKKAGPGHKLSDTSSSAPRVRTDVKVERRGEQTEAEKAAAAAALARFGGNSSQNTVLKASHASILAQARKQLEREKQEELSLAQQQARSQESPSLDRKEPEVKTLEAAPVLAASGVYFKCPLIGDEILSREEWTGKIREFLYSSLEDESETGLTACLIIKSLNSSQEKVDQCVETILKYLKNILDHPSEEKYHKIRVSNRIFQERVSCVEGSLEFLRAAGFQEQEIDGEQFLVYGEQNAGMDLEVLMDALTSCEPLALDLDRNVRVLIASSIFATSRVSLPRDFFERSKEELKREAAERSEKLDLELSLRTKAMRERDEELRREVRHYKYCIVRVKFPDNLLLQGTFSVTEPYSSVLSFVRDSIHPHLVDSFSLSCSGLKLAAADEARSLLDLQLVPAALFYFNCVSSSLARGEAKQPATRGDDEIESFYLKPELRILASDSEF